MSDTPLHIPGSPDLTPASGIERLPEVSMFNDETINGLRIVHERDQDDAYLSDLKNNDPTLYIQELAARAAVKHAVNSAEFATNFEERGLADMLEHPDRYDNYDRWHDTEYPEPAIDVGINRRLLPRRKPDAGVRLARLFNHQNAVKRRLG